MIYESFKQKEIKEEFQKVTSPYDVRGSSAFFENEMINYTYKEIVKSINFIHIA